MGDKIQLGGGGMDNAKYGSLKSGVSANRSVPIVPDARGEHVYALSQSVVDYANFPAIRYYLEKYSVFPSSVTYCCAYNYADLMERISGLKKEFYCESLVQTEYIYSPYDEVANPTGEQPTYMNDFFCFEYEKEQLIVYASKQYMNADVVSILKKKKAEFYSINVIYNPDRIAKEILDLVKKEIIGLPPIPTEVADKEMLHVLVKNNGAFDLMATHIIPPDIDFDINYNSDFTPIHNLIIEKLSKDNSKGIVLLHGKPGTGKTTYIRHLISRIKKKIIYIPPNMANYISDPELIKFFMAHSNALLIIEDAENVLMKRAGDSSQAIANILNLSDGLLSDCMNMQIVATFNTNVLNIDEALLRKGRLIAKYEFNELEASRAKLLSEKLGVNIGGEHTLADIYNATETGFIKKRESLGFKK